MANWQNDLTVPALPQEGFTSPACLGEAEQISSRRRGLRARLEELLGRAVSLPKQRRETGPTANGAYSGLKNREGLNQAAVNNAAWIVTGYGATQLLRFGSNLILTRLLVPEVFGM